VDHIFEATWAAYAALRRIPCSFIAGVVAADKEDRCPHDEALSRSAAATPIELNYAELLGQCSRLDLLGGWLTSVLVANELLNALVAGPKVFRDDSRRPSRCLGKSGSSGSCFRQTLEGARAQ